MKVENTKPRNLFSSILLVCFLFPKEPDEKEA